MSLGWKPRPKENGWWCLCECGTGVLVRAGLLLSGHTQSCGCYRNELTVQRNLETKVKDLTGQQFGRLTVKKRVQNLGNEAGWECECSCGNTALVPGSRLRSGNTQSCGCYQRECISKRGKKEPGVAGQNILWGQYRRRSKQKNFEWDLTKAQFVELTSQNCVYCDAPPAQVAGNIYRDSLTYDGAYLYNGIDRVDSKKGYVQGNVVPCCGTCNIAKRTMTHDQFLAWIQRVYNHNFK